MQQERTIGESVGVIGGGAIGGYAAAMARAAGEDVTLCVRSPIERLELVMDGQTRDVPVRIATHPGQAPAPADWVLVTTKAQDTAHVGDWLSRLVGPATVVAVMQNGLDHQKRVAPFLPAGTEVLPVLVDVIAERVSPGRVVHHHGHRLFVPATSPAAARFAGLWHGSPVQVVQESEFVTAAWRKLLINIVANPLTALLQERIGVFREPEMSRLAEDILREAAAVARAEDAHITEDDIHGTVKRFMTVPADGGTSMLYDRLARRPMEHEFISGPIVHAGERHDIPTPLNRMLLTLMRTVDRRHAEPAHDSTPAGAACRGENVCRR